MRIKHPSYPTKTIVFKISKNDVFNMKATVTISGISDEQKLGSVLIDPDSSSGYSKGFNLESLISKVAKSSLATLTIRIEYQSFSGYNYCEKFHYNCTITERGIQEIKPHEKHPIKRKLIKEGY